METAADAETHEVESNTPRSPGQRREHSPPCQKAFNSSVGIFAEAILKNFLG